VEELELLRWLRSPNGTLDDRFERLCFEVFERDFRGGPDELVELDEADLDAPGDEDFRDAILAPRLERSLLVSATEPRGPARVCACDA